MKTFLEIGTADFDTLLPLAEKGGWYGWCVEPIPKHAETLRKEAAGLPVGIIECAISDFDGHIEMAVGTGEKWAEGASHVISSNHSGRKLLDMPINAVRRQGEIEVKCLTLDTLIDNLGINELDFCKIDVEGHELEVLSKYSWKVKPKVLKVEHKHLPGGSLDRIIRPQGYTIFVEREDIYCVL
jgi:FkbM family methyltransferase